MFEDYLWIVVVGGIGAFGFGWATGANDVANVSPHLITPPTTKTII
jgi:hypothetical protein